MAVILWTKARTKAHTVIGNFSNHSNKEKGIQRFSANQNLKTAAPCIEFRIRAQNMNYKGAPKNNFAKMKAIDKISARIRVIDIWDDFVWRVSIKYCIGYSNRSYLNYLCSYGPIFLGIVVFLQSFKTWINNWTGAIKTKDRFEITTVESKLDQIHLFTNANKVVDATNSLGR